MDTQTRKDWTLPTGNAASSSKFQSRYQALHCPTLKGAKQWIYATADLETIVNNN